MANVLEQTQNDKKAQGFIITRWTAIVADNNISTRIKVERPSEFTRKFRLRDDDNNTYFYGFQDPMNFDEFAPLDEYGCGYGCTQLQYREDDSDKWKSL
tara:strand:- start:784 stop:1080 length:297 start_codon:yes stop_codon:yes gene_type:complete